MENIRVTHAIDPKLNHDCDRIHIDSYSLKEVILPATRKEKSRRAIQITIRGRNFKAAAQPLVAFVGKIPVRFLRIAPDERTIEGVLLHEPEDNASVDVLLGDEDHARSPQKFNRKMIRRID